MNQTAAYDAVFIGICDDDLRFRQSRALGTEHVAHLAVRQPDHERLSSFSCRSQTRSTSIVDRIAP